MGRIPVTVRAAAPGDVPALRAVWDDVLRRADDRDKARDVERILDEVADDERREIVVAEYDGQVVGAVYLQATTLTPLNLEPSVLALSPHVLDGFRRKGVGTALMDAAVRFAEQRGIGHLATAAVSDSRDGNRFMARLSLVPQAVLRVSTTQGVRGRLSSRRSAHPRSSSRHIDRVIAARRGRRMERTVG
jgi:predicted N-acetyltransferase YhbS